ncbi:hypothetical protein FDECE_17415 [Fusarium decemcellulare]|nr:hypothetical protein FDECE_17415 [Fusarium decemcellulare]
MIGGNLSPIPQFQTEIRPFTSHTSHVLAGPLSSLPPAFRGVEAASLLDSFTELTAPRMVGKGDIENPFITDERCRDENLLGFFSEQYSYLAIVANIGIGQASSNRLLDPRSLPQPLHTLNQNSPIYGFMFGCSHGLFGLIPGIARLSSRHRARKDDSIAIQKEYDCILSGINSWIPNSQSDDPGYKVAGEMYRAACLVFLHTSMKGHQDVGDELYNEIEPSIALFLRNFKQLSGETPPWATFMWPTLVVGSCMREESQRKTLLQVLGSSRLRMQTVDSTAHWLSLHWERMDKDAQSYGIDGLEKTMKHQGLDPCVG